MVPKQIFCPSGLSERPVPWVPMGAQGVPNSASQKEIIRLLFQCFPVVKNSGWGEWVQAIPPTAQFSNKEVLSKESTMRDNKWKPRTCRYVSCIRNDTNTRCLRCGCCGG